MTNEEIQRIVKMISFIIAVGFSTTFSGTLSYIINKLPVIKKHNQHLKRVNNNEVKYEKQIENYNREMFAYCDEIKKLNLSDLELFIKLFDDLWKRIDGYSRVADDVCGLERLYLKEENKGSCRHFSDDMIAKLNYINPKYHARKIIVYVSDTLDDTYNLPIKRTILPSNPNFSKELFEGFKKHMINEFGIDYFNEKMKDESILKFIEESLDEQPVKEDGNHIVCAVDIPDKNITLMLDPTNSVIGYFKGKKIITFGGNKTGYKYVKRRNYIENKTSTFVRHELKSGLNNFVPYKIINRLYGEESQEEAYEKVLYVDQEYALNRQKGL